MNRYLLHVSYIGTAYRGVTHIHPHYRFADRRTVQGALEHAMAIFKPINHIEVNCSSRTDARVHALDTTFHVDLEQSNGQPLDLKYMCEQLNKKLKNMRDTIRVHEAQIVCPDIFKAYKNVAARTYLYRLAVHRRSLRSSATDDDYDVANNLPLPIPIEETDRCFFIQCNKFDVERMKAAASLFVGEHDFRTFMRYSFEERTQNVTFTQRRIDEITISDGKPCVTNYNLPMCEKYFQFYEIRFTAKSYIYRQIRRIVGTLCAVAKGKITQRDVYEMLTIPSHKLWKEKIVQTAPACALYLINVEYKPLEEMELVDSTYTRPIAEAIVLK